MKPVQFCCTATLSQTPEAIAQNLLEVDRWKEFNGYGPLPGIARAEFLVLTPEKVGSRISVVNRDGSTHIEEIVAWELPEKVALRMSEFSLPLAMLATEIRETWRFRQEAEKTEIDRSFEIVPRARWTLPLVALIAWLLKQAIRRHLEEMAAIFCTTPENGY